MNPSEYGCYHTRFSSDSQSGGDQQIVLVTELTTGKATIAPEIRDALVMTDAPVAIQFRDTADSTLAMLARQPNTALVIIFSSAEHTPTALDLIRQIREDQAKPPVIWISALLEPDLPDNLRQDPALTILPPAPGHPYLLSLVRSTLDIDRLTRALEAEKALRKTTASRLRKKRDQLSDLIQLLGDMVWQTDTDNCFTRVSGKSDDVNGYPSHWFTGQPYQRSMTGKSLAEAWPRIKKAMADQSPFLNIEISRTHEDGATGYFLTSGKPEYDDQGIWIGYQGAEKDISRLVLWKTEKQQLVEQLRQAQRLEAMGTLAGGIAHDFNNILGGILGYAQLIQFEIKDRPNALAYTEHIVSGCNRAKNLILQILDFSRQRGGQAC